MITIQDFDKIDVRVGIIIHLEEFPEAKKPAYKLRIDLGSIGIKNSSVQITHNYRPQDLMGKQVLCVVNLHPRKIGPFISDVLTLGVPDEKGNVILINPDKNVPAGGKLY